MPKQTSHFLEQELRQYMARHACRRLEPARAATGKLAAGLWLPPAFRYLELTALAGMQEVMPPVQTCVCFSNSGRLACAWQTRRRKACSIFSASVALNFTRRKAVACKGGGIRTSSSPISDPNSIQISGPRGALLILRFESLQENAGCAGSRPANFAPQ